MTNQKKRYENWKVFLKTVLKYFHFQIKKKQQYTLPTKSD